MDFKINTKKKDETHIGKLITMSPNSLIKVISIISQTEAFYRQKLSSV